MTGKPRRAGKPARADLAPTRSSADEGFDAICGVREALSMPAGVGVGNAGDVMAGGINIGAGVGGVTAAPSEPRASRRPLRTRFGSSPCAVAALATDTPTSHSCTTVFLNLSVGLSRALECQRSRCRG
jgi:hypothetical protein